MSKGLSLAVILSILLMGWFVDQSIAQAPKMFIGDSSTSPRFGSYPVTELRLVREPGNFHFIRTHDGDYVLSDYWWREIKVGSWNYNNPGFPPNPGPIPPIGPGPRPPAELKKVYVEIIGGKGLDFFNHKRITPVSFTLVEDFPRTVRVEHGRTSTTLTVVYDGYHVDLGMERAAKTIRGYNGSVQSLGSGQGLRDVEVIVYWEEDNRGEVRVYKNAADPSAGAGSPEIDRWGEGIKSKILQQKSSQPNPEQGSGPAQGGSSSSGTATN